MSIQLRFVVIDDKDRKTEISDDGETVIISKNGVVRELHLSQEHARQLDDVLDPWLEAGHQPGQQPEIPDLPELPGLRETRRERADGDEPRSRELPGTRDFYRELREWAAAEGIDIPTAGRRPGKRNYVYKKALPVYLAHLRKTAAGRDDTAASVAIARLATARLLGLLEENGPALPEYVSPFIPAGAV